MKDLLTTPLFWLALTLVLYEAPDQIRAVAGANRCATRSCWRRRC